MFKLLSLALVFFTFAASAQTKTIVDPKAKIRTISSDFTALSVATGITLYLTQADDVSLAVSVNDEKYEDGFKTEVENGVLKIFYVQPKKNPYIRNRVLKAYLSVKDLEKITVSSGAQVETVNAFKAKDLALNVSSGAGFDGGVVVTNLKVDQSSGSDVEIKGSADNVTINSNSGASFEGYDLISSTCTANVSSGADIELTVNKELEANASSGGSLHYKGNPTLKNITKSSGGSVKKD